MKILVLASTYPKNDGLIRPMYIHMRCKFYLDYNINVDVLNFSSNESYDYDGVNVISLSDYKKSSKKYDMVVSHAPNLKNHYLFLVKNEKFFNKIIFIYHGHEVLRINYDYPDKFSWKKESSKLIKLFQNFYDSFKLKIWKRYIEKKSDKIHLAFVSNWMKEMFIKNTKINENLLDGKVSIIYNSVGELFELNSRNPREKEVDFITVRRNIDGEKYCVDYVNELAEHNPTLVFKVIGKGELFNHINKADNLIWEDRNLNHDELMSELDKAKCALMPTKTDAQGLLMCEMATYGIPVITSNIDVCIEVFSEFENVLLIDNNKPEINLERLLKKDQIVTKYTKNRKYCSENTTLEEVKMLFRIHENTIL